MAGSFHLEPDPKLGVLEGEQRRRIWASLLELELAASVMCGMPTMLTPDEYTCQPPRNLNDDELADHINYLPTSRGTDTWTDTLCQFTLASSLRQRLQAYRLVTKASPEIEYDCIIDHARQLENVLQSLPPPLRFSNTSDDATHILGRLYARIHLDMAIRRTMIALYTPFAVLSIEQDPYKEARVGYVQSCLIVICYQDLFDPAFAENTHDAPDPGAYWDLFYQDFKREILRSTLGVCLEIKWMRHMGFDTDPPGTTVADVDPTRYYDPTLPTNLWKIPAWTAEALKAIDDSLEPMIRRVGRSGSDLKDLGCIAIVYHSIKNDGDRPSRDAAMKTGLTELIAACQRSLQEPKRNSGLPVPLNGESTFQGDSQYLTPDFNFNFDDLLGTNITLDDNTTMQLLSQDATWQLSY